MANFRLNDKLVKKFDEVAGKHRRTRTGQLEVEMIAAIKRDFPDTDIEALLKDE